MARALVSAKVSPRVRAWVEARAAAEHVSMSDVVGNVLYEAMIRDEIRAETDVIVPGPDGLERIITMLREPRDGS